MKPSNSFSLSIITLLSILASGYLKLGVEAVLASVCATYVIGRASQKGAAMFAISKDPNASSMDALKEIER